MFDLILGFITAFLITYFAIPSVIKVAVEKNLCDEPGERTSHSTSVPTLGGFAIFAGIIFSITFWTPFSAFGELQYILCAFIILFMVGAKDDIVPISPGKKFIGQILAAFILVYRSNIQLTSLYGVFNVYDLPPSISIPLSIFTIILIINAVNLIDGINGLSASIGIVVCTTFGSWFYWVEGNAGLSIIAFAMSGSLVAFLKYNITPAKIFMGDTGSLLLGLVCAILTIKFIEVNKVPNASYPIFSVPAVAIGVMIIPLFDTLRVFTIRLLRRRSPFHPDRNHIHHLLLDIGLSHMQGTSVLVAVNIFFIFLVYSLQEIGTLKLLILILTIALSATTVLFYFARQRRQVNITAKS